MRSCVAQPTRAVPSSKPGLATAGTGDVLCGLVAALLGQGMGAFEAARAAAFVHGLAGDRAAEKTGKMGLVAGDLIDALGPIWAEWGL